MRSGRIASLWVAAIALFAAPVTTPAQDVGSHATPGASSVSLASANRADSSRGDVLISLPSVTVAGAPRSYQVVTIPVPDELAQMSAIQLSIVPRGEFVVLGPRNRELSPRGQRKLRLPVTIGIPASALAGRIVAAEARFSAPGSSMTMVVPIEIDVSLVRKILLRNGKAPLNAQAGNDVVLPFEIVNAGNAVDTVSPELDLPSGWIAREIRQNALVLSPGETAKRHVRLKVPTLSSTGSSFVHLVLLAGRDTLAAETMTVEVFNSSSIGREAGPLITSAVSQAVDENGRPNRLVTLNATGALFDSVHVDARMSQGSVVGGAASNAFAHLGTYQSSASVNFSAPSGQLSLGNTGTSFSDLTGLYPYGQGLLLHVQHPAWSVLGLGAMSMKLPTSPERKPMLGIRAEKQLGFAQLSGSMTHLEDAGPSPRRLDAVGVGAAVPAFLGGTLKAEIAERRFDLGNGIGWSSELVRLAGEGNEQLRVTHAPGGSDAFARATNEVVANVSERVFSRGVISASAWRTTDATSVFSGLKSNGFSLRPQLTLFPGTTMALEARSYQFDATSRATNAGAFGSREQQLGTSVSTYMRQYYLNTSAFLGNVTRTVTPFGQAIVSDRTPRNYWTTNAGWSGAGGLLELQMRIEQTRDRGGFVNQQSLFGIRGEQLVLPWFGGVRGEGELQRVNGFGDEKSSIMRAGLVVPIVSGFALKVDAERNSIFHSTSGKVPWVIGVRFEHTLVVPMLRTPGTSGYVFEDMNGNQRRDDGEPGVPGAIVRRGSETAVADGSGKYRVGGDGRQPVTIDEASLPDGWSSNGPARGDLAVSLSRSAEIELVVAPRSGISSVQVDLSKAHVIAKDAANREWAAVMTGPTTATFQSLPVGTYKLDFDLSELSEPLVPRTPIPQLMVTGKDSKSITITLDPRPIRMWNGGGSRGGQK
ncbi:MAG TPA: NEW3 domain-containing protein [Gemmatimonadaceae bacterium]